MKIQFKLAGLLLLAIFNFYPSILQAQGALTPPGAPAPTMKSLGQIEPRMPISSLPYNITSPGSYYLTTNLTGISGTNGITITADNVTIDLRGFILFGVPGALDGIHVPGDRTYLNLVLQNGTVRGWPGNGVDADNTKGSRFNQLNVTGNSTDGLNPGVDAVVHHCIASDNGLEGFGGVSDYHCTFESCTATGSGDAGFYVYSYSVLANCDANNNGNEGFNLDFQCVVRDCTAAFNGASGINIDYTGCVAVHCVCANNNIGLLAADHCTVRDCNATFNFADGISAGSGSIVESCTAAFNGGQGISAADACAISGCTSRTNNGAASSGIVAGDGCSIKDCVVADNPGNGIVVSNACLIEHNVCRSNGSGNTGDGGIRCLGNSNRIDDNHLVGNNANGLFLDGSGNTVVRNTAKGNTTTQYFVGSGNDVGPIGSAATSTSPWANLQ